MACRKFEVTLISAANLQNVREVCQMKVHARVSITYGGVTEGEKRTWTDMSRETNPVWNFPMRFAVAESVVNRNAMLVVKLYCTRTFGDRYIGEVSTSMKELFHSSRNTVESTVVSFPVRRYDVVSQGTLKFSYRFGERVMIDKLLEAENSSVDGSEKEFPWMSVISLAVDLSTGNFDPSNVIDVINFFTE